MARSSEDIPLVITTIRIFKGDLQELQRLYPRSGASKIIRNLIRNHLKKVKERAQERIANMEELTHG